MMSFLDQFQLFPVSQLPFVFHQFTMPQHFPELTYFTKSLFCDIFNLFIYHKIQLFKLGF